jgi:transposase-like protein
MKLLYKLETINFGYGFVLNQFIIKYLVSTFQKRNRIVAEKFIRSLIEKYGKHTVYTDGGTWYDETYNMLRLKQYLYSPLEKSLMERINQYLKDRIESFDDYYLCIICV